MEGKILVAYASKHGATAEIAEKIAEVLKASGIDADLKPAKEAGDVAHYAAVVLGSAAYIGQWRKEVVKILTEQEEKLALRPVWLFYSGPSGEGDPVELLKGRIFPDKLKAVVERIKPVDTKVFHGDIRPEKFGPFERWIIKTVKSPVGDFRDWDAITAWAKQIAAELQKS